MRIRFPIFFYILVFLLSGLLPLQLNANQATEPALVTIEQLQAELDTVPESSKDNADLQVLTAKLSKIQQDARILLATVTQQVTDLESKLTSISTPATPAPKTDGSDASSSPPTPSPDKGAKGTKEPAAPETVLIEEQRSVLQKERDRLDANRKILILIISEAEEKSNLLVAERRQRFKEELSLKVRSIFSPTFWTNWNSALPSDLNRLNRFTQEVSGISQQALKPENRWPLFIGIFLSAVALVFTHRFIRNVLDYIMINVVPTGRARRSFFAAGTVLGRVLAMSLVCGLLYLGLNWNTQISPDFLLYLRKIVYALILCGFIYGLGEAILSVKRETWRLVNLNNEQVHSLRHFPIYLLILTLTNQILLETGNYIGTSFIGEVSIKTILTLLACLLSIAFFSRLSRRRTNDPEEKEFNRPLWLSLLIGFAWLVSIIALVLTLIGYVSLGSFLINQIVWSTLVFASFFICWRLADDFYQAILSNQAHIGKYLIREYEFSENSLNQIIVVLSAISKLGLIYLLLKVLLLPFGTSITQIFQNSTIIESLVAKNTFAITSGGVISAVLVFVVGFWLIRIFKSWLDKKYFPNTKLEKGVQSSISTMSGYLGGVAVIALSLGSLGLSFDKITWVASALSVGIGFGLQSIVQNFISGLILLTERPVKVGDWVIVGADDGDIKRINIRATEIQLADRSTLIVPNSEFITKAVRNLTLDKSEGRVQIKLPLPISTNPRAVADMILEVFKEHEHVLKEMSPFIRLDSVDGSNLLLSATCYVPSPRMVGQVRTELLFEILDRLHKADITLISPVHISQVPQKSASGEDDLDFLKS